MSENEINLVPVDPNDEWVNAQRDLMDKIERGEASGEMCTLVDGVPNDEFALQELLGDDDNEDEIDEAILSAIKDDGLTEDEAQELYGG